MADKPQLTGVTATLVLVRHGESTWIAEGRFQGRLDPPLSPLGERQAALAAARLAGRGAATPVPIPAGPPVGIWHSPLSRAAQTASQIARLQPADVALFPADGLIEIAQGEWEGLPHAEVRRRWEAELAAWRRSPVSHHAPGGEALPDAARRVAAALGQVVESLRRARGEEARPTADAAGDVASLHYDPVPGYPSTVPADSPAEPWAVLVAHDGIFRLALMTLLDIPLERFWSFPFNLCAISVVSINDGVPVLRAHNLSEHLAPLAAGGRAAEEARGDRRGAL